MLVAGSLCYEGMCFFVLFGSVSRSILLCNLRSFNSGSLVHRQDPIGDLTTRNIMGLTATTGADSNKWPEIIMFNLYYFINHHFHF